MIIQWFPGHMAKAHRMIKENIKLVDVVVELLDARAPYSSSNPIIREVVGTKPKVIALNKMDLADPQGTKLWLQKFKSLGLSAVALDSATGRGVKDLVNLIEDAVREKTKAMAAKGLKPRAVRAMILGIPNVGKSSLINRLIGGSVAKTGDKPGVTRGKQWIRIGKNLELLDTPGVLWPKFEDVNAACKLAFIGAINDDVYDMEKIVEQLVDLMQRMYPERLQERYGILMEPGELPMEVIAKIAARRGCLRSGGVVDYEKAGRILLNEFRMGKLGKFTLDLPGESTGAEIPE